MGLTNFPRTSQGAISLQVTAGLFFAIFKDILKLIIHVIGIRCMPDSVDHISPELITVEQFPPFTEDVEYSGIQVIRFKSLDCAEDIDQCSVCLMSFDHESYLSRLSCGHFFHKACLDKWLDCWQSTCPLCRAPLVPEGED